jgi:hypothetical protein
MNRRPSVAVMVIGFLVILGMIHQFANNPSTLLIPLIVFGTIFILWKFPPHTWKGLGSRMNMSSKNHPSSPKGKPNKRAKFRVIQGNKGKIEDEEEQETPKYH